MSESNSEEFDFLNDIGEDWEDISSEIEKKEESKKSRSKIPPNIDNKSDKAIEDDEFVSVSDEKVKELKEEINPDDPLFSMGIKRSDYPKMQGDDYPQAYSAIVDGIIIQYSKLPKLEYGDIYAELSDLSIKSCPTPTLQVINDEIEKVQSAKDRLGEIYCNVLQNYHFKKRAVDILESSWSKYTVEKNADKRKGDALFRISEFSIDFGHVESLVKVCQHILKNLDSLHESLSRRITINQLLLKLNDIGRGSLPMQDFNSRPLDDLINASASNIDGESSVSDKDFSEVDELNF